MAHRRTFLSLLAVTFLGGASVASAASDYTLMQGVGPLLDGSAPIDLTTYLIGMYKVLIGVTGVLAVVRIVICGIQIMATASPSAKSDAKSCIGESLLGILIAVGSFAFLNTISPQLTTATLDMLAVDIDATPVPPPVDPASVYSPTGATPINGSGSSMGPISGVNCPGQKPVTCGACSGGSLSPCSGIDQYIDEAALSNAGIPKDVFLRLVNQESSCGKNLYSSANACGLVQMLPGSAQPLRQYCGISEPVTCGWLADKANWKKSTCLAAQHLKQNAARCGDLRSTIAAYNAGAGRCKVSASCATDTGCSGIYSVQQWQCPYDDTAHVTCNTGLNETKNYVYKICG